MEIKANNKQKPLVQILSYLIISSSLPFLATCSKSDNCTAMATQTGLDVLVSSNFQILNNKRVGVITNQTSVDRRGRHIADLLFGANNVTLTTLFAPEHGIRGEVEGGVHIDCDKDAKTGVPIFSLYGKDKKPTPEMLKNLDILIFDIQDVGTRFYTYISTMSLAMEVAAENQIPFIVLDRPNPISGKIVEGPVLHPEFSSFVGIHPIPLRHGMTIGELAKLFNEEGFLKNGVKAELTIIQMIGWRRDMFFEDTGLSWVKPSPNMPSPATALLYPGTGLLEATNISEGRGSPRPFEIIGAPWIKSSELIKALKKTTLSEIKCESTSFVPVDIAGTAMNPKYEGQRCNGLLLRPRNYREYQSVRFGINLLSAIHSLYPNYIKINQHRMALMIGVPWVYDELMDGVAPDSIIRSWQVELNDFLRIRKRYLLYD